MHQLLHLPDCVRDLGPLYTSSCFDHEHSNGLLARMVHSNCGVDVQISFTFSCLQSMCALAAETNVETEHLQELLVHYKTSHNGVQLLNFYDVIPVTDNLSRILNITQASLERFGRLKVNNEVYHAEIYERPTKFNNSAISYIMQEEHYFGIVSFFCSLCKNQFAIVKPLMNVSPLTCAKHVFVCNKVPGSPVAVPVSDIICRVVYMSFADVESSVYVATFPNVVQCD